MIAHPDLHTTHLTADQIDDHLIGDLAPAPAAHLAACALCADRVAAARSPLDSFHTVSTAWSERRSATLPIPAAPTARPLWQRHSAIATACLAFAFGATLLNANRQLALQPAAPPPAPAQLADAAPAAPVSAQSVALIQTASASSRSARIAADNRMLRAMAAAFDPASDSPAALGLAPEAATATRPPTSLQD